MIENEIFCYINSFLKWNISKTTSYIIGNKIFLERFAFWKKVTKEIEKIIIKNTYRWNSWTNFKKWITKGEFVLFRSTIDLSRSRTRRMQFIIINFVKFFCFNLCKTCCSEASHFKVGSSLSFLNLKASEIISWIALS